MPSCACSLTIRIIDLVDCAQVRKISQYSLLFCALRMAPRIDFFRVSDTYRCAIFLYFARPEWDPSMLFGPLFAGEL